jgi:ferritin
MWADLVGGNYKHYALLKEDDPFTECLDWFWTSLNEDDTYPKEFLEYLIQMVNDIETGKVETIPMTLEELKSIADLVDIEE